MKKIAITLLALLLMAGSYLLGRRHSSRQAPESKDSKAILYWVDPMHPDYKSDHPGVAPDCGMQLEPVYAQPISASASPSPISPGMVSIDPDKQQLFGIRVSTVEQSSGTDNRRVLGRVMAEDTRVYKLNSGMEGFVRETANDSVGVQVRKDQKLATYYSGDILAVASGYLAATAGVAGAAGKDGARSVPFPGAVAKQGQSSVQGYADRLRNLGMSDVQIREMAENRQLPDSVQIVSPVDGFILSRTISPGQHFDHSTEFYQIADLSRVWIVADILGSEAQHFQPGTAAHVFVSGTGKEFKARVSDALPQVDPATRTLKLRLEAENPGYALRPDMFVDLELSVSMPSGLTVPADAVIDSGREQRVFVERSKGVFEPRQVHVGWRSGDRVQIVSGLSAGESVVSAGTFLVDSESRMKSSHEAPHETPAHPHDSAPRTGSEGGVAVSDGKVKDAACGMMIDKAKAIAENHTVTRDGVTYYFCSERCQRKFSAEPERNLAMNPTGQQP